jgi:putative hydrolase of the HAD superfamily
MIFFDLDDTLLDHQGAQTRAVIAWQRQLGAGLVPHSETDLPVVWQAAAVRHRATYERGQISFVEQCRRRIRDVLRDPEMPNARADEIFERYQLIYEASWQLFSDVLPTLELLSGQRLGVLTRGNSLQQELKLTRLGLKSRFETVIVLDGGWRVGSPVDAFELASKRAAVNCADCFFIGNDLQNGVLSACLSGWRGIWIERSGTLLAPAGVESISSLRSLPALVKNSMV